MSFHPVLGPLYVASVWIVVVELLKLTNSMP